MTRSKTPIFLAGIAAFTILAVWAIASGKRSPAPLAETVALPAASALSGSQTQTNEGNNVTVAVTPQELAARKPAVFQLVFDTHSVNLDFDVASISNLRDDQANTYGQPTWSGDQPGGHHRKGTLTFPTAIGKTEGVTLLLTDIAGIKERRFEWKL